MSAEVKPLVVRLQIKPGMRIRLIDVPPAIADQLVDLPEGTHVEPGIAVSDAEAVIVALPDSNAVTAVAVPLLAELKPDALFWVCYPKKSGSIPSDLSRDDSWDPLMKLGWRGVRMVSADSDWSAFRIRPESAVKQRGQETVRTP
jgi:hypothetical protein